MGYGYHWAFSEFRVANWNHTSIATNQIMRNLAVGNNFAIIFPYKDKKVTFKAILQEF